MKITIAIDSFKGSLTSLQAGNSVKEGILKVYPNSDINVFPLADGGEGTVNALVSGMNGVKRTITVSGPLGKPIKCNYGLIKKNNTAVIEMASAAGLTLIGNQDRNPLVTTTYGVGEIIKDAINEDCRNFIIGIGGSATNDCGIGMLQALGFSFYNKQNQEVTFGALGLSEIVGIRSNNVVKELAECSFRIACDVNNPLCGENGASIVYSPQKGASLQMANQMDKWFLSFSHTVKQYGYKADENYPGAGAAGGLGFAFLTFLNAKLESGVRIILDETKIEEHIKSSDIVITGEGRLDSQTAMGKAPIGVAKLAKKYNKIVLGFSGCVSKDSEILNQNGIDAYFPILRTVDSLDNLLNVDVAKNNLTATVTQVFSLIRAILK